MRTFQKLEFVSSQAAALVCRLVCSVLLTVALLAGCGGNGSSASSIQAGGGGTPAPTLQITPANLSLPLGTTQQLKALETNANGTAQDVTAQVTWASSPAGVVTVSSAGAVKASGKGAFSITGTLGAATGSVTGTVTNAVAASLAVQPDPVTLAVGATSQLKAIATYTDASTQDVTSSVTFASINPQIATVSNAGLVSAAAAGQTQVAASYTPAAGAQALTAQAAVTVNGSVSGTVAVQPGSLALPAGATEQFAATVNGVPSTAVGWAVDGVAGGNAATGTISNGGLYMAPSTAGSHTVTASSGGQTGSAQVSVVAVAVVADFGSRSGGRPIAPQMLGAGVGGNLEPATFAPITSAGLTYTRFHANIQQVYAQSTPDWSGLDATLAAVQAAGMHAILEVDFTPKSLYPAQVPCPPGTDPNYASPAPTDVNAFAQMAASYVTHIDHGFPGVVQDYEIWNEPDGGGLCTSPNTPAAKLQAYLPIFAAVAPALKAAAQQDGVQIRVGGPTLGSPVGDAQPWLSALLSNPQTAPYVDFVSFHYYVAGPADVANGLTWYGSSTRPSLLNETQDTSTGLSAVYTLVEKLVRSGSQPNAASTPIYMDEYNSDFAFENDCCRNDPTYAPLWNSLAVVDLLNSIYSGASTAPSKLLYYAISNPPFCLLGQIDAQMDCNYPSDPSATPQAYPQYYALQLFASPSFLGLSGGGSLANTVQSGNADLVPGAFYTANGDTLVVVNPSDHDEGSLTLLLQNPGLNAQQATVYTLNSGNPQIATSTATFSASDAGYLVTVPVPQQSTVAVTLH